MKEAVLSDEPARYFATQPSQSQRRCLSSMAPKTLEMNITGKSHAAGTGDCLFAWQGPLAWAFCEVLAVSRYRERQNANLLETRGFRVDSAS